MKIKLSIYLSSQWYADLLKCTEQNVYILTQISQLYVHISFCLKVIKQWLNMSTGGHVHVICILCNMPNIAWNNPIWAVFTKRFSVRQTLWLTFWAITSDIFVLHQTKLKYVIPIGREIAGNVVQITLKCEIARIIIWSVW